MRRTQERSRFRVELVVVQREDVDSFFDVLHEREARRLGLARQPRLAPVTFLELRQTRKGLRHKSPLCVLVCLQLLESAWAAR